MVQILEMLVRMMKVMWNDLGQYLKQAFVGLYLTWVFILSTVWKIQLLEDSGLQSQRPCEWKTESEE